MKIRCLAKMRRIRGRKQEKRLEINLKTIRVDNEYICTAQPKKRPLFFSQKIRGAIEY